MGNSDLGTTYTYTASTYTYTVYSRCCIRICSAMIGVPHSALLPALPTLPSSERSQHTVVPVPETTFRTRAQVHMYRGGAVSYERGTPEQGHLAHKKQRPLRTLQ